MSAVIGIILQLLPFLSKAIGSKYVDLGAAIAGAVDALWTAFKAGNTTDAVLVSLQQLETVLTAVKNDTGADSAKLALAVGIAGIVTAAITGLQAAEAGADPALLPVPPEVV
jgi:hypothetical protein